MELSVILLEFALFIFVLFVISIQLWRLKVDQATVLAKLGELKTSVETLINRPAPPTEDLQPIGDAIDALKAEVDAKNAS
jgi:hypothetical protein